MMAKQTLAAPDTLLPSSPYSSSYSAEIHVLIKFYSIYHLIYNIM